MLNFYKIYGDSMEPTISSGSYIFALKKISYSVGDIVVVEITEDLKIIKRIVAISNKKIKLSGDNNAISSSLCEPWYSEQHIMGKVILNLSCINKLLNIKEPSRIG